jgi:predicted acyl esterase
MTFYAVTEAWQHVPMVRRAMCARFRTSQSASELLEPGRIYGYTIDLWRFGISLAKGWRFRVELASAYFPEFSRNLNTGGNSEAEAVFTDAVRKIHHSAAFPSHILLPVRRAATGVQPCAASDSTNDEQ